MSDREIPTVAVIEWHSTRDKNARGAIARGLRDAGYRQYETAEGLGVTTKTVQRYEAFGDAVRPFEEAQPSRPVDNIPDDVLAELYATHQLASRVRGFTPLDAPERLAVERLAVLLHYLIDAYGVTTYALSLKIGLSGQTFDFWLKRHGHRPGSPSQPNYQNVHARGGRKRIRVIGGECGRGHVLTPENVYQNARNVLVCKRCALDNSRRRYLASKAVA
jgi:hypothetical protein